MNKILNLKIYTPNSLFLEETITKISIYGKEGLFTILPNHIDYVSSFNDGMLFFKKENNENVFIGVNQGILIKCGREVQISTFNAIYGGQSVDELRKIINETIKREEELINFEKKLKISLKSIEFELLKKIRGIKKYD